MILLLGLAGLSVLTLLTGLMLVAIDRLGARSGMVLLAATVLLALTSWMFARRSVVVDRALQRTHFSTG